MIRLNLLSFVGSTSECQNKEFNEDEKGCDHLKKVPICGYVHDTSPVKNSAKGVQSHLKFSKSWF